MTRDLLGLTAILCLAACSSPVLGAFDGSAISDDASDAPARTDTADASPDGAPPVDAPPDASTDAPSDISVDTSVDTSADAPADGATPCSSDAECAGRGVCDRARGVCAQCVTASDCTAMGTTCSQGRCVPATMCVSSRMCPGQVCDTALGFCVDCLADVDCTGGQVCRANLCAPAPRACRSSRECSSFGQVCNTALGQCADCVTDVDCTGTQWCAADGTCRARVCAPGASECVDLTHARACNAHGSGWDALTCASSQSCAAGRCTPWTCAPRTAMCVDLSTRRGCNDDGLGYTTSTCPAGQSCSAGACLSRSCTPGATSCVDGLTIRTCNADGLGYSTGACPAVANATPQCAAGACAFACNPGFGDCNRVASDGCEVNGLTDRANCGGCGLACAAGQSCVRGTCQAVVPVDVMVLLDASGSTRPALDAAAAAIQTRLVTPLLALSGVQVGVSHTNDFPVSPYGELGDRAFQGGIEPSADATAVLAAITGRPRTMTGGDGPDGMIEALSTLSGLPLHPTSLALTCSSGRVAGGCWRPDARRVIVLFTDDVFHNGPLATGTALESPYGAALSPPAATWPAVLTAMRASGTALLFMNATTVASGAPFTQWQRMLSDLGQPSTDVFSTSGGSAAGDAADQVIARIRTIRGM